MRKCETVLVRITIESATAATPVAMSPTRRPPAWRIWRTAAARNSVPMMCAAGNSMLMRRGVASRLMTPGMSAMPIQISNVQARGSRSWPHR